MLRYVTGFAPTTGVYSIVAKDDNAAPRIVIDDMTAEQLIELRIQVTGVLQFSGADVEENQRARALNEARDLRLRLEEELGRTPHTHDS